jgi:hypothetical protein
MNLAKYNSKMKKTKIIKFEEVSLASSLELSPPPKPAITCVPNWYKKDKSFTHGNNDVLEHVKNSESYGTYKMCVPLTDSMTSGYNVVLPASIIITNDGSLDQYIPKLNWKVNWPMCDAPAGDLKNYPIPYGHDLTFFRWILDWKITTPLGYSLWITHPSQRYDLPFTTINGFVDTDLHPNKLFLPFFVRSGYEGKIEAGTPIAQIIPIKRESWKSEVIKNDKDSIESIGFLAQNNIKLDFIRTYKNRYWSRKKYL